jgi:hypothetical protein
VCMHHTCVCVLFEDDAVFCVLSGNLDSGCAIRREALGDGRTPSLGLSIAVQTELRLWSQTTLCCALAPGLASSETSGCYPNCASVSRSEKYGC